MDMVGRWSSLQLGIHIPRSAVTYHPSPTGEILDCGSLITVTIHQPITCILFKAKKHGP